MSINDTKRALNTIILWPTRKIWRSYLRIKKDLELLSVKYAKLVLLRRFKEISEVESPVVLFASCTPGSSLNRVWIGHVDSLIGAYLKLTRKAQPVFFFNRRKTLQKNVFAGFGFGTFYTHGDLAEGIQNTFDREKLMDEFQVLTSRQVNQYEYHGVPVGRLALASARYELKKSRIETEYDKKILRQKILEAIERFHVAEKIFQSVKPDVVVTSHSTYINRGGVFFHLAIIQGIPSVTWQARGVNKIIARSYSFDERMEHVGGLSCLEWKQLQESSHRYAHIQQAKNFIEERMAGEHLPLPRAPKIGIKNQPVPPEFDQFPDKKPLVAVFTHLPWDASGAFYSELFDSVAEWVAFTAEVALENDRVNWIFRIHPAEAVRGSKENTAKIVRDVLPDGVFHIRIIDSNEPISSYALARKIKCGITVRGTLATELPCLGIPVICAGSGPTSVANFNIFPKSIDEYREILKNIAQLKPLSADKVEDALLFAYGFFIDKPITLQCVDDFSVLREIRRVRPNDLNNDSGLQEYAGMILNSMERH
jgi:hypothetical protein